jgi:hypothetical protein
MRRFDAEWRRGGRTGVRGLMSGLDQAASMRGAYPAFAAAGMDVTGIGGESDRMSRVVGMDNSSVLIVEWNGGGTGEGRGSPGGPGLCQCGGDPAHGLEGERERFKVVPNLMAGFTKPVS